MILLDTNILVRHLTREPEAQARRATALLASRQPLLLVDVVLAECVYVLRSVYRVEQSRVAQAMRALIRTPSVVMDDADLVLRALEVFDVHRLHFAEAYLVAVGEQRQAVGLASFDRSIDKVGTVTRLEP